MLPPAAALLQQSRVLPRAEQPGRQAGRLLTPTPPPSASTQLRGTNRQVGSPGCRWQRCCKSQPHSGLPWQVAPSRLCHPCRAAMHSAVPASPGAPTGLPRRSGAPHCRAHLLKQLAHTIDRPLCPLHSPTRWLAAGWQALQRLASGAALVVTEDMPVPPDTDWLLVRPCPALP